MFEKFEDRGLKKAGAELIIKKNLSNGKFIFAYFNGSLNSDKLQFSKFFDQLRSSLAVVYAKNPNVNKQVGIGLSFSYTFGQPTIFPLALYNNDFSLHWGLKIMVPKSIQLRYSPNEKVHLYYGAGLVGSSFNLQNKVVTGFDELEFGRTALRTGFNLEREIHDWLWVGVEVGYNIPLRLFITQPGGNASNALVDLKLDNSIYTNFSIFIVPPRKLLNKAKSG